MSHYSEMNFLFSNTTSTNSVVDKLDNTNRNNSNNIFNSNKYVIYKHGTKGISNDIKGYYKSELYTTTNQNPYTKLLSDFKIETGKPGAGLKIKAADLAYLRDLGVYPINRMIILRRFPEGVFVSEDLSEVDTEPLSTIVGWIKPDQNFGTVGFNENWTKTTNRFDKLLVDIVKKNTGIKKPIIPIPDFAQGMLFEFYNKMELLNRGDSDDSVDELFDSSSDTQISNSSGASAWGLSKIPIGDPNVLQEGPFRDPVGQNIQSNFNFEFETTYEQKLLGDVDPGSAMMDIIDNISAMGTSNMTFYWGDKSPTINNARTAAKKQGNNLNAWWDFVSGLMKKFWEVMTDFFKGIYEKVSIELEQAKAEASNFAQTKKEEVKLTTKKAKLKKELSNLTVGSREYILKNGEIASINIDIDELNESGLGGPDGDTSFLLENSLNKIQGLLQSILTSTVAIHRFEIRGSIELMVGGKYSSTPWHISLGNPYSPWIATNHIIVKSASIESSTEMGFNDQPQKITAKIQCEFSRALGKQEIMRMFNNSFRRTYDSPQGSLAQKMESLPAFEELKQQGLTPDLLKRIKR